MSHTPGTWTMEDAFKNQYGIGVFAGDVQIAGVFGQSRYDIPIPHEYAEAISNARLIAASPELLAALKSALYTIRALDENYDEHDSYVQGMNALAHAEGRP